MCVHALVYVHELYSHTQKWMPLFTHFDRALNQIQKCYNISSNCCSLCTHRMLQYMSSWELTECMSRGLRGTHLHQKGSTICTNAYLNILTHFLWEGPTEPQHPSLCTAAVAWTTSITVPQWVFKGYSIVVLPSTSDSRFTKVIESNKVKGSLTRVLG